MKNNHIEYVKYATIAFLLFSLGAATYFFHHEWIIISIHKKDQPQHSIYQRGAEKKSVSLWYFKDDMYNHEEKDIIVSPHKQKTLHYLLTSWLSLLDEEHIYHKKISLESVMVDHTESDAFISFNRNPFDAHSSIYEKWMFIESLLKTIDDAQLNIQQVMILHHGAPLKDEHLDFSRPWPIQGFYSHHAQK
jgi:hypothetical protein